MRRPGRTRDARSIAVIGAGRAGLGTAVRLRQAGFDDVTLFERCDDLGPATGVLPQTRLGTQVRAATFDRARGGWLLDLEDGSTHRTDVLITATGAATRPCLPPVPGGAAGRRVAVLGTGLHAAGFVRHLVPDVTGLWVFSGPPPHQIAAGRRLPSARAAYRRASGPLRRRTAPPAEWPAAGPLSCLRSPDPSVAPQAGPAAPRPPHVTLASHRRPPLDGRQVRLVADRLAEIGPHGLVGSDGTAWAADVVLFTATFTAAELLAPLAAAGLRATAGQRPVRLDGPGGYLGVTVAHLPNLYLLHGLHQRRARPGRRTGEPGLPHRVVRAADSRR